MKIAYQGIAGSYSESCAKEKYPNCETISCKTFDECFEKADKDSSVKAIIPFPLTKNNLLLNIIGFETKLDETFSILIILPFCRSTTIILPSEFVKYKFLLPIANPIG